MQQQPGVQIGLDVGDARVGVALSRSGSLAQPYATYVRAGKRAEKEILALVLKEKPELIVCGLPLSFDGTQNEQCQRVFAFAQRIQKRSGCKLIYIDEYCTSADAGELLSLAGKRGKRSEARIDAAAATLILQTYLDDSSKALIF